MLNFKEVPREMIKSQGGRTILFVSHPSAVQTLCSRACSANGRVIKDDQPRFVIGYLNRLTSVAESLGQSQMLPATTWFVSRSIRLIPEDTTVDRRMFARC
jgi:hypothetical protein